MISSFLGVRLIPAISMLLVTFLLFSSCQKDEQVQPSSYSKDFNSSMTAPSVYPGFGDYDGTGGGGGGGNDGSGIPLKEVPITGTTPPPYSPPQSGFDTGGNPEGVRAELIMVGLEGDEVVVPSPLALYPLIQSCKLASLKTKSLCVHLPNS